ncbi:MAG: dTDP-4-dehydrorhamnose reductase [Pseudomonadota bacterium]|jgi:dTDP-4-dehydrorhamnose reductase
MTLRIVLLGPSGQVGWELARSLQCLGTVHALGRAEIDFEQPAALRTRIAEIAPQLIINAVAWTAVDDAEQHEARALAVNGHAPGLLACIARECGALLIHYSTDYVFDGTGSKPWKPDDPTNPLSAYGRGKLAGEQAIAAAGGHWLVLRTSWVYAARGRNFVRTMLRLGAQRESLRVVNDQIGAPTSARLIADVTAHVARGALHEIDRGVFHSDVLHLTASGETSWHGLAQAIFEEWRTIAPAMPLAVREVQAIPSRDYPVPAPRPLNSRLDCSGLVTRYGLTLAPWRDSLRLVLAEIASAQSS